MGLGVQGAELPSPFTEAQSGGSFPLHADTRGLALNAAGFREPPLPQQHSPWMALIRSLPTSQAPTFLSIKWDHNNTAFQACCDNIIQRDRTLHSTGHTVSLSESYFQHQSITVSTLLGEMKVSGCYGSHQTNVHYSWRLRHFPAMSVALSQRGTTDPLTLPSSGNRGSW